MDLPIPKHLQEIIYPIGMKNSEFEVTGEVRCTCGCKSFEIWESNDRQLVKTVCENCKKEYLLFDSGKHGWNGFVCGDDFLDREMPLKQYGCSKCKEYDFSIVICISSQGKADFEEDCLLNDDSFTLNDWINAFDWITISLSCKKCGATDRKWLDFETM